MDKYICGNCGSTFNKLTTKNRSAGGDGSYLVNILTERCSYCGSYNISLTEHGKLLIERQKKIQKLDNITKK
jgi:ribosomal protein S27AE